MTINQDIKDWVTESYDTRKEAYYVGNARAVIENLWFDGVGHGIVSLIASLLLGFFCHENYVLSLNCIFACQLSFILSGLRQNEMNYGHDPNYSAYICSFIFWVNIIFRAPAAVSTPLRWIGVVLFIITTLIVPLKIHFGMKRFNAQTVANEKTVTFDSEEAEFRAWKERYYNRDTYSRNSYYSNDSSYSDYSKSQTSKYDPYVDEAQRLFADFGNTYQELKKRYRKLAMQYHPDKGGDAEIFKAIVTEYEHIKETRFPGQK